MEKKKTVAGSIGKQELFLKYYLSGTDTPGGRDTFLNAYASGVKAGYSKNTALSITKEIADGKYRKISEGIQAYKEKALQTQTDITPQEILKVLKQCCSIASNPSLIEDWPEGYSKYYPTVMRGVELAGKYLKMFVEKLEVSGGIQVIGYLPGEKGYKLPPKCPNCGYQTNTGDAIDTEAQPAGDLPGEKKPPELTG